MNARPGAIPAARRRSPPYYHWGVRPAACAGSINLGELNLRRSTSGLTCSLLVLAASPDFAGAAGADTPQQCAMVSDDGDRLACYDRIFRGKTGSDAPGGPAAAAAGAATASGAVAAAASNPQQDFGLTEAAKRALDPERAKVEMPESVTGKVTAVGHRPTGELVVTLANGQVWLQIDSDSRAKVGVGQTVTIKKASLGSYLLIGPDKRATRVRRIK